MEAGEKKECIHNYTTRFRQYLIDIWQKRCEDITQWERQQKIYKKQKHSWNTLQGQGKNKNINTKNNYYPIVNNYMNNFINNFDSINTIFTTSLDLSGIGSALAC